MKSKTKHGGSNLVVGWRGMLAADAEWWDLLLGKRLLLEEVPVSFKTRKSFLVPKTLSKRRKL